jgi:hypothetical protein
MKAGIMKSRRSTVTFRVDPAMLFLVTACFGSVSKGYLVAADVVPLHAAHAHNDYWHPRPLFDALEQGFCSFEADVFLIDGELRVGHARHELTAERTLAALYLEPLRRIALQNGGRIYPNGPTVTLLVDIKSGAADTFRALEKQLATYASMLTQVRGGETRHGAVQVVVSGNRPVDLIAASDVRLAFVDGRLSDLEEPVASEIMPLISDRWTTHFRWRGEGPFSLEEKTRLESIVAQAHDNGQRVRFWATPDRPEVWQALIEAEVDHINTDDLNGLARFLRRQTRK